MLHRKIKEALLENHKNKRIPNAICLVDSGGRGSLELASEIGLDIVSPLGSRGRKSDYIHPDLHYIYPTKTPKDEKRFDKGMNAFYNQEWREFMKTQVAPSGFGWYSIAKP